MARQAIRREGDKAVTRFRQFVAGSKDTDDQKRGDAVVSVDGEDHYVEIKECHAAAHRSGTLNQVRPIKYIPLVVDAPERGCWYVIPANELVRIAATKERGQHTEIPFECMNLTLRQLEDKGFECADNKLSQTVIEAVRQGKQEEALQRLMVELLEKVRELGQGYKTRVNRTPSTP